MEPREKRGGRSGAARLFRAGLVAVSLGATACLPGPVGVEAQGGNVARLKARPGAPTLSLPPGRHELGLGADRDGMLFVPSTYRPEVRAPLIVFLHGAGGRAAGLEPLFELAEEIGAVMLMPESRGRTWDGISGRFGADVAFLDRALEHVFEQLAIDPRHVAISGFSDGGSYALSLGLANGGLFSHLIAFSPGFMAPPARQGKPPVFIAHGTRDGVLPIAVTSRRIVPQLTGEGYEVTYQEFDGPHVISLNIAREALAWFRE